MKREEIEKKLKETPQEVRELIEKQPLGAVVVAFFVGVLFTGCPKVIFTIAILAAAVIGACWFLDDSCCDKGSCEKKDDD